MGGGRGEGGGRDFFGLLSPLVARVAGLGSVERRGGSAFNIILFGLWHRPVNTALYSHGSVSRACSPARLEPCHEPVPEPEQEDVEGELALRCQKVVWPPKARVY